ncbi:MAG: hypothetical protein IKI51_00285 [Clostridia bacterium]|nr:hypothetical protein [Clostridia bacterium]
MPDFSESDSVYAIVKNLAASNAEYSDALLKRISHIYDLAAETKVHLRLKLGKVSLPEAALVGDEARVIINDFFASLPKYEDGEKTNALMFRALKNFDAKVFRRALADGEKFDVRSASRALFGAAEAVPPHAEKRVALLNNAQSSRAFELFAAEIHGAISSYEDNFQSACEAVYSKDVQYAIIPVSSNADGRLDGLYRMMEKYGLAVNMTCRVSSSDGSSTCFALVGRPTHEIISRGRAKFEFKIALDDISELSEISEAAEFFGAALERADALPGLYGRDNTFGLVIDIEDAFWAGLFVYFAMRFPRLVPIGIYSHITEE